MIFVGLGVEKKYDQVRTVYWIISLFMKLHITAQFRPVILVILCHTHSSSQGGINDTCYVCVVIPFILDVRFVDVSAGVTQEEGHTGFLHLPSAALAFVYQVPPI